MRCAFFGVIPALGSNLVKKNIDSTPSSVNSVVAHVMWIRPTHCDAPDWSGSGLVVGNIATITAITLVARVISLSTWWPGSGLMLYDRKNTASAHSVPTNQLPMWV